MTVTTDLTVWEVMERQLHAEIPPLTWNPGGPRVVAIDSEKGGVGKSGLAGGLIAVMAANGRPVLGIDLDPRATLTAELGATEGEYSVNDLLYEDPDDDPDTLPELSGLAAEALRPAGEAWGPNVHVLAAERALANRETDNTTAGLENRLRVALQGVAEQFAVVVIDLPPRAGGRLVSAGLLAATDVLFPGTLTEDGVIGVRDAMRTCKFASRSNPGLRMAGVVRNIVEARTRVGQRHDDEFRTEFAADLLDVAVPKRVIRQEARTACVPITAAASNPDARDLINGYTHVLNRVGRAA